LHTNIVFIYVHLDIR